MRKILVMTNNPEDGAAVCRVQSFSTLPFVNAKITNAPTWQDVADAEIVVVHRPVYERDLGLINLAKKAGAKVWVDADDAYFDVPEDHRAYDFYRLPRTKEIVTQCIERADVVTISNPLLKESFGKLNSNMHVTLCSYSLKELLQYKLPKWPKREKRICWRGSDTHFKSLKEYGPAMVEASKAFPDWEWYFIGDKPWTFMEDLKRKRLVVNAEYIFPNQLHSYIASIQPAIQVMPLTDNYFTRCRSNMAWMDGLVGGAICIGPDWEHWRVPGVLKYGNSPKEFEDQLLYVMECISKDDDQTLLIEQGWDHMLKNYSWEAINQIQNKILEGLV